MLLQNGALWISNLRHIKEIITLLWTEWSFEINPFSHNDTFWQPLETRLWKRGKRRKCWLQAFSPFPTMFSSLIKYRKKKFCCLTHSYTMTFWRVRERRLFNSLQEKEKILVTSIFSFSHNVFNIITNRNYHLSYIYFVFYRCLQFGQGQVVVVWECFNCWLQINALNLVASKTLSFGNGWTK